MAIYLNLVETLVKKYGDGFEIGFKHARRRMVRVFVEVNEESSTYPVSARTSNSRTATAWL